MRLLTAFPAEKNLSAFQMNLDDFNIVFDWFSSDEIPFVW